MSGECEQEFERVYRRRRRREFLLDGVLFSLNIIISLTVIGILLY